MANKTHQHRVAMWLNDVSALVANPTQTLRELKPRIASMTSLLADDFPDARTFSGESLRAIGAQFTFFPAYHEIQAALGAWWREHGPPPVPLMPSDIDSAPLSDEAKLWAKFWRTRTAEGFANGRAGNVLSLIRAQSPDAYDWLIRTDAGADDVRSGLGWESVAVIDARRAEIERRRLDLVARFRARGPVAAERSPTEQAEAVRDVRMPDGRKPGALSDAHLAEVRKATGTPHHPERRRP